MTKSPRYGPGRLYNHGLTRKRSLHLHYILSFPTFHLRQHVKYPCTSRKHGEIAQEWTTEVGWNLTFFVGCTCCLSCHGVSYSLTSLESAYSAWASYKRATTPPSLFGCSGVISKSCVYFNLRIGLNLQVHMVSGAWMTIIFSLSCLDRLSSEVIYRHKSLLHDGNQAIGHKYIRPKSIHDADVVEEYSKYYMYLACIKFINSVGRFFSGSGFYKPSRRSRLHLYGGIPQCWTTSQE